MEELEIILKAGLMKVLLGDAFDAGIMLARKDQELLADFFANRTYIIH